MEKSKKLKIKKCVNYITCPFRAVYATVAVAVWEVLSFGILSPYTTALWNHAYLFFKFDETD